MSDSIADDELTGASEHDAKVCLSILIGICDGSHDTPTDNRELHAKEMMFLVIANMVSIVDDMK